jgi:CHAT domain-containing protein
VVAHDALGALPLAVLPSAPAALGSETEPMFSRYRSAPWLARSHAITVLPSVSSLVAQRALPAGDPTRRAFAGFADPWFSEAQASEAVAEAQQTTAALTSRGLLATRGLPVTLRSLPQMAAFDSAELEKLPRLPDTREEVRSIALAMNADLTRDLFTGKDANEGQIKTMELSGYKVLAFATHGLVPGDLNGLTQPALALSAPDVAGVDGDGLLTMGEILGLKLDADWVVLSACNTAAAEGAGAEAISGLGRAFFYAGARALLVSNWPVETTSARLLTTDIFRRQVEDSNLTRAQALRGAMLGLMDGPGYMDGDGRTVFSYAHPIFWAPFTLVGDGGHSQRPGT